MTPHPANPVHAVSTPWPTLQLGEVLRHRKEWITIDDLTNYKRPRVQLHVQGIVVRDEVPGALIKTKTQQVCRTGEFLVAVVARIEELAAQIHEARTLRQYAAEEAEMLMAGEERKIWPDENLNSAPHLESLTTFLARGRQSEQGQSEHFLIKTQHVQQDRYVPTLLRLAPHIASKVKPAAIVQDGDILIACSAAGCLGRVARYRSDGRTASTDTHVAVLRPDHKAVDHDYLYAYLRGAQGQHQIRSRERGNWQRDKIGFRLTELNLNDLRRVPVPVPPLPEQRRIVAQLDALQAEVDALKGLQAETGAELDALLPAMLDRAFKAEL